MKSIGILWNSMNDFREEALNDIQRYASIENMIVIDFKDKYLDFLGDIYPFDGVHKDIHIFKGNTLIDKYESNDICILFLDLPDSTKEFCDRKHTYIYKNIEELKQFIRNKYKNIVNGYVFDNIFHMTDDEKEYLFTLDVVNRYLNDMRNNKVKVRC